MPGDSAVSGDPATRGASAPGTAGGQPTLVDWDGGTVGATPPGTGPAAPHRRQVTVALAMGISAVAVDLMIVANAVPLIARDLGALHAVGWLFTVNLLAQTVSLPMYGSWADMWGRKVVLLFGTGLFTVGAGLSALSGTAAWLVVFRGVQGLGAGAVNSMVNTLAGDLYSVHERPRVQILLSGVWAVSMLTAPMLGGVLVQAVSWRWIFLVTLPLAVLSVAIVARYLREPAKRPVRHRFDVVGLVLLGGCLTTTTVGLLELGRDPRLRPVPMLLLGSAVLLAGAFAGATRCVRHPLIPRWVWGSRSIGGACLASAVSGLCAIGLSSFLPLWAQVALGMTPVYAGAVLALSSTAWPVASMLATRISLRLGFRTTALAGAVTMCVSAVGFLTAAHTNAGGVAILAVPSVLMGLGLGLLTVPLLVGAQNSVPWERRGVTTGSLLFARQLGQCVGAAAIGAAIALALRDVAPAPAAVARAVGVTAGWVFALLLAASLVSVAAMFVVPAGFGRARAAGAE